MDKFADGSKGILEAMVGVTTTGATTIIGKILLAANLMY